MMTPPTAPSPGKPVSASFFARLIAWVKSGQLIEGPNYRLRRTPNGTALDFEPANSHKAPAKAPGCFEIRMPSGEDRGGFDNPYFTVGSRLYRCHQADTIGFDYNDCIIYLKVDFTGSEPESEIDTADDFSDLQDKQETGIAIIPLYQVSASGSVVSDLRNIPTVVSREFVL